MAKKSKRAIAEAQRARQQRVRDQARERRRPSRDDLARVLLWQMIMITEILELQGFDIRECEDVFDDLVKRYANGVFPFRRKRHLEPA